MNKHIFTLLFLLLAVQGMQAGFISAIFKLLFGGAFKVCIITFRFFEFSLNPPPPEIFSMGVVMRMKNINMKVSQNMEKFKMRFEEIGNKTAELAKQVSNKTVEKTIGKIQIDYYKEASNDLTIAFGILSAVSIGCTPDEIPAISIAEKPFPPAPSCLSVDCTTNQSSTVGCQATTFQLYAETMKDIFKTIMEYANSTEWVCPAANGTNVTAIIQPIIDQWEFLIRKCDGRMNDTQINTLMAIADGEFNASFAAVSEITTQFFDGSSNFTEAILKCAQTSASKPRAGSMLKRAGTFTKYWIKKVRRGRKNRKHKKHRKGRLDITVLLEAMTSQSGSLSADLSGISQNCVLNQAKSHSGSMNSLSARMNALVTLAAALEASSASAEASKDSASTSFVATYSASLSALGEKANMSASCQASGVAAVEGSSTLMTNVEKCITDSGLAEDVALANATVVLDQIIQGIGAAINATNDCYSTLCAGNILYPYSSFGAKCVQEVVMVCPCLLNRLTCAAAKPTAFNACMANVVTSVNGIMSSIDASVGTVTAQYASVSSSALTTLIGCITTEVGTFNGTFVALEASCTVSA